MFLLFAGSDKLNWRNQFLKGSAVYDPGFTPAKDLEYTVKTWTQLEQDCGHSRILGGVHFNDSINNMYSIATSIANGAVEFVLKHLNQ